MQTLMDAYEDFFLSFYMELREKYHFRLSADMLLRFLKISEQIDLTDEEAVCQNMMMFFCHQQHEAEKFPEIFHHFYMSEKEQSRRLQKKLERQKQAGNAAENRNVFLQEPTRSDLTDQKVHFTLPNFEAERFFAQYELQEGICDYSRFIHAGFLNLYDDYISYYDSLKEPEQDRLISVLVKELQTFLRYCRRILEDPADISRKTLELAATFKMAGYKEQTPGEDPSAEEMDAEALEDRLEEEKLRFQQMEDTRVPMSEDFTKKDIRLLTKQDMEQIEKYIRENAHKFKARMSRNLKKAGKTDFDCKATVKEAFRTGMIPIERIYKNPRPRKTRIVCMLDISPSCLSSATVLIHFLYQLKEVFCGGVEICFFTDHAEKVSQEIRSRTIQDTIARTAEASRHTVSNYSEALESFLKNYYSDLTRDTIFLLLGDMRNNYKRYRREPLAKIHARVHSGHGKTVLLNTEPKRRWYTDDSVLRRAEENLDEIYEVRTVEDIVRFLNQLEPA